MEGLSALGDDPKATLEVSWDVFFHSFPLKGRWELTVSHDQSGNPNTQTAAFTIDDEGTFEGTWSQPSVAGLIGGAPVERVVSFRQ